MRGDLGPHGAAAGRVYEGVLRVCKGAGGGEISRTQGPFFSVCAAQAPFTTGKNTLASLAILRIANGLLKRLSKSDDSGTVFVWAHFGACRACHPPPVSACPAEPVFCGRILMFLAAIFPLSERSGVNSTGAFNVNPTPFDATGGPAESGTPTDVGLYQTFWSVQELVANPARIMASREAWAAFLTCVTTTAAAFDGQGVVVEGDVEEGEEEAAGGTPGPAPSPTPAAEPMLDAAPSLIEEFYCTKYLTNIQLFNLQVPLLALLP